MKTQLSDEMLGAIKAYVEARVAQAIAASEPGSDGYYGSCSSERKLAEAAWQKVLAENLRPT